MLMCALKAALSVLKESETFHTVLKTKGLHRKLHNLNIILTLIGRLIVPGIYDTTMDILKMSLFLSRLTTNFKTK